MIHLTKECYTMLDQTDAFNNYFKFTVVYIYFYFCVILPQPSDDTWHVRSIYSFIHVFFFFGIVCCFFANIHISIHNQHKTSHTFIKYPFLHVPTLLTYKSTFNDLYRDQQ